MSKILRCAICGVWSYRYDKKGCPACEIDPMRDEIPVSFKPKHRLAVRKENSLVPMVITA